MLEKNIKKIRDRNMRGMNGFNTGIRVHKSAKFPSRNDQKIELRKLVQNY